MRAHTPGIHAHAHACTRVHTHVRTPQGLVCTPSSLSQVGIWSFQGLALFLCLSAPPPMSSTPGSFHVGCGAPKLRDRPPVNGSRLWPQLIKSGWAPGSGLILNARKPSAYRSHPVPSCRDGGQTLLCLWWPRPDLRWRWGPQWPGHLPTPWGKGLVGRAPRGAGRCSPLGPPRASDPACPALHLFLRAGFACLSKPHGAMGLISVSLSLQTVTARSGTGLSCSAEI